MEKHFKVGDRVVRTDDERHGVIVECPCDHAWGKEHIWFLYDEPWLGGRRGPYWLSRSRASQVFEFENNKEDEVTNTTVTDKLYEMMCQGLTPDAMREAIAEAEKKAAIYQQGFEAGVKEAATTPADGPVFELQYDGVWRKFRVVGIAEPGRNSDLDALLRVKELSRGSVVHPEPLDKSYGIVFPASKSRVYRVS
jgi:hypothetical protein